MIRVNQVQHVFVQIGIGEAVEIALDHAFRGGVVVGQFHFKVALLRLADRLASAG